MRVLFIEQTAGHNPHRTYDKPTGGTLTSLTFVTEYLAKQGHEVYVQSKYDKEETVNGVNYILPESQIKAWDVVVFGRNALPKDFVLYNKQRGVKVVWWLHDIVDTRYLQDDAFKLVDHIVALSDYCKETYADFYSIDRSKFSVISNGVDSKVFYPGEYDGRDRNLFLLATAPIKGYAPIELTFTTLMRHNPDLDFRIYSNQALHGLKNTDAQTQYLEHMKQLGAHVYPPVSPDVLAHLMRKAWCLLMPNSYPEICSNLLLQARACGLPVVTTDVGANAEFVGPNLTTRKYKPHDMFSWTAEYAQHALDIYLQPDLHKKISQETPQGVPTWEGIGNAWNGLLERITGSVSNVDDVSAVPAGH